MSLEMLVMFAVAMLAASLGRLGVGFSTAADVLCLLLLGVLALMVRYSGLRKPVV